MGTLKKIFKAVFSCFANFNERNWVYKIVALIGVIVRVGFLPLLVPNIFDVIAEYIITQLQLPQLAYEIVIRIILYIFECIGVYHIFYWASYGAVGNSYESGKAPAWGSFCYSLYYIAHMAMPILICQFFYWWVICVTFLGYVLLCAAIYLLSALIGTLPDEWRARIIIHSVIIALLFIAVCLIKGLAF